MSIQQLYSPTDSFNPNLQYTELMFVEDRLQTVLQKADGLIRQTCLSLLQSGGKRIRPLLTLYSGMCFAPLNPLMIEAGVASELIHMASLIHDDVIDEASTRRGKPTIGAQYGNHAAILTGDYLFAEAFSILAKQQLLTSMSYLVEAIQAMCHGEVHQADEQFSIVDEDGYFNRIAKKTGILLAACTQSGAALAGATLQEQALMREYGLNLGYAYQITDDILDINGDSESLGKPVGSDLINGNITLPMIYLLDKAIYGTWLKEIIKTRRVTPQGALSIREALINTGCIEEAYHTATQCIRYAKASLNTVSSSPYKTSLLHLADMILHRKI
ncbi:geranylgeranyl pyrophosphate synthase [Desulfosporosinus orientis DSM 765]|uniref:Geranylgeranyl pyrophosphate synthase n=1 Tax=Desulfosporosinus orientis (strain ATCC 19365 / DSM 765 / NCIMB 8382 / VKM B-1628 / Singapore I) TaxID=768706 RepID=G7W5Q7_DESOD|nr:polyprenyl synthetase family protein [Desulfosporosinus orientis]AET66995.1 geranylgeranyl pyrophosphate synthase [Desulfosporosinus orientis DSM 765]